MYRVTLELNDRPIATTDIFEEDDIRALNKGKDWADSIKSILKRELGPLTFASVTVVTKWSYITEQLPIFNEMTA